MLRLLPLCLPLTLLAACMTPTPQTARGGNDGVAAQLSAGISRAEAEALLGMEAGFERNPADWDESCVSYAYGDGRPRYVHAVFRNGTLQRASDGHGAICTFEGFSGA
jgi:hypothetical protein